MMYRVPIGKYVEIFIEWLTANLEPVFKAIKAALLWVVTGFEWAFEIVPSYVMVLIIALIAWRIAGKGTAIFSIVGLVLINSIGLWAETMQTLAMVITSALIALIIGIPLGIWMSRNNAVNAIMR
ncbi:MAG: glycine/betaine ABC transporter, partial [Clostridiales bacterium]|nr:glycine/betaine ABC transporter [Clostridiales bacterium]